MNTPEQPLQPPEATVVSEPEFERDPLSLEMIDAKVLQPSFLIDRIQLCLNEYNSDNPDIDTMALLLGECQQELIGTQKLSCELAVFSDEIEALTEEISKQAY